MTETTPTTHEQLIAMGWECTVEPVTATMGSGKLFYTLVDLPKGLWSTARMKKLTFNDACAVQGCLNRLAEAHVNG